MSELLGDNEPVIPNQGSSSCHDSLLAIGSKRDIRDTGVLATKGPLCLAMTSDEDAGGCHDACVVV